MGCVFGCRHKRRFEPLPLSVRYALERNISVLGTDNQPIGVVFGWLFASAGCFVDFWYMW